MSSSQRTWRVLAYIVGDQGGLPRDEAEQIDAVATEEAKKMVRAARGQDNLYLAVHVDLTLKKGGELYVVPGPKTPTTLPEDRAGLRGIVNFVKGAKELLPATHTMVILWGHGGGPLGLFSDPDGGGDGATSPGQLSLSQLQQVLEAAHAGCGGQPIDILLVKSCYVATLEAARQIDSLASYMICSQARVPLRTWSIWEEVFEQLDGPPDAVVQAVMTAIDAHYADVAERNGRTEVPFSLLRPAGVARSVQGPMKALCEHLHAQRGDTRIARAIEDARPAEGGDKALLDVRTLCANLINVGDPHLAALARQVDLAIAPHLVVRNTPPASRYGGVGLFHFPRDPLLRVESFANEVTEQLYSDFLFSKTTTWDMLAFPPLPGVPSPHVPRIEVQS